MLWMWIFGWCAKNTSVKVLYCAMSKPLRLANFAAIRSKANLCRRALVKAFMVEQQLHGNSNPKGVGVHNRIFIIYAVVLAYLQRQRCAINGKGSSS